jgi:hypothetical protein
MKVKTNVKAGSRSGDNVFQQAGAINVGIGNQAS